MNVSRIEFVFLMLFMLFPAIAIVRVRPKLSITLVVSIAILHRQFMLSNNQELLFLMNSILIPFVGALAVAGLLVPILIQENTLIIPLWRSAGKFARLAFLILLIMLGIATINTWYYDLPAAGTAISILIWPLALLVGFGFQETNKLPEKLPFLIIHKFAIWAILLLVVTSSWFGTLGHLDIVLGVLGIALFSLALSSRNSLIVKWISFLMGIGTLFLLQNLFPDSQSVLVGCLFGSAWMLIMVLLKKVGNGSKFFISVISLLVFVSIFITPVMSILLFEDGGYMEAAAVMDFALGTVGESQQNFYDRPARWMALINEIKQEPFRLQFTNFLDTVYYQRPGVWESAQPHNIVIALGRHIGVIGMVVFIILIIILLRTAIVTTFQDWRDEQNVDVLAATGIIIGIFFRNMWSIKLFIEPLEIVFMSIAVLSILYNYVLPSWDAKKVKEKFPVRNAGLSNSNKLLTKR